jgi:hypothetical protein
MWGLSALGLAAVSYVLLDVLGPRRTSLRLSAFLVLAIGVTTIIQLLFGLLGWLSPVPLGVAGLAAVLALLAWPNGRVRLRRLPERARALLIGVRAWWNPLPAWLRVFTLLLLPVLVLRFLFLVWTLPPFVWDSLTYHLPNVAAWTQAGRIFAVESPVDRMLTPANFEVFATWFTAFLHHDIVVEAAGLPAYALGVLSVYALGRAIGLAPSFAWVAALGYATTPALLLASTGTKNDPIVAAVFLFVLAVGWEMAACQAGEQARGRIGEGILAFLAACLALGTKAYILQLLAGVLVVVWLVRRASGAGGKVRAVEGLRDTWRGWSRGERLIVTAAVLAALVLAGVWYARNWAVTGNPLYPYGVQIGEATVLSRSSDGTRLTWEDFATNMRSLLERLGDKRRITPDLPGTTGWGWVAYGLGVPALLWGLVRSRRQRILFAGFLVALVLIVQASPTSVWMTRFLAWLPALLCLTVGEAMEALGPASKSVRSGFAGLLLAACGLNVAMTLNYNTISPDDFRAMLRLPALERQSAALRESVPEEYAGALALVPGKAVLGYNVHGNGFTYPLYRADFSQRLAYVPIPAGSTCESIAAAMQARGTRYLFVAPEHTEDWILALLNDCATQQDVLRERTRGLYVVKRE